ncbi:ABC transporter ATP-binding protein [Chloroflexota bacterium]
MPLIETVNLWQRREEQDILQDINISVNRGEIFAIIGPTGSGKTTLLRLIDLIDTPTSGKIMFDGVEITASEKTRLEARRRMGFVLQKPVVFNMSVYDNIACGLKWRKERKSSIRQKVDKILEMVSLTDYKDRNARTLSGGETQMVAIARAIVSEPEVLLLDEPTANLDPTSASRVESLITDIIRHNNTTIIMATHDMAQGQRLADRVGVLLNGKIRQSGDWLEVFSSPQSKSVASFVGVENIIDGKIASSQDNMVAIQAGENIIEAISNYPVGEEVCACIRPEDITLARERLSSSARNSFTGKITRMIAFGALTRVEIDCGFPLVVLITKRSAEEMELVRGKQFYASFKATGVHVIKR